MQDDRWWPRIGPVTTGQPAKASPCTRLIRHRSGLAAARRELDVLKLVAQGLSNPDIARRLS